MKRLWLALISCALSAAPASAAGADGTRRGSMQRGADSLPVEVVLSGRPGAESSFTARDLGAVDVPLSKVSPGRHRAAVLVAGSGPAGRWRCCPSPTRSRGTGSGRVVRWIDAPPATPIRPAV